MHAHTILPGSVSRRISWSSSTQRLYNRDAHCGSVYVHPCIDPLFFGKWYACIDREKERMLSRERGIVVRHIRFYTCTSMWIGTTMCICTSRCIRTCMSTCTSLYGDKCLHFADEYHLFFWKWSSSTEREEQSIHVKGMSFWCWNQGCQCAYLRVHTMHQSFV